MRAFIGDEYTDHNAGQGAGPGAAVVRAHLEAIRATFPDLTIAIEDMIAEGDRVVTRVSGRGTHRGAWQRIRPTGTVVHLRGINIDRVAAGRLVAADGVQSPISLRQRSGPSRMEPGRSDGLSIPESLARPFGRPDALRR